MLYDSPMYECKVRFKECNPAKQMLQLLDRVESIEKVFNEAVKVKNETKVVMPEPGVTATGKMTMEEKMEKMRAARKAKRG